MEELLTAAFHIAQELPMTILRQRMIEDMQVRNFALNTQKSYLLQISQFARHFHKSPELLEPDHIRNYQLYLTNDKGLSTRSIHLAVSALRFLYKVTLKKDWKFDDAVPFPRVQKRLPVVLSPNEVVQFLGTGSGGCVPPLRRSLSRESRRLAVYRTASRDERD